MASGVTADLLKLSAVLLFLCLRQAKGPVRIQVQWTHQKHSIYCENQNFLDSLRDSRSYPKLSVQLPLKADVLVTWVSRIRNIWIMFSLKYTKCILKCIPKKLFAALPSSVCQPPKVSTENTCRQEDSLPLCFSIRKDDFPLRQVRTEILPTAAGISSIPWSC